MSTKHKRHIPYKRLAVAEEAFLVARGWVQKGPDAWIEPRAKEGSEPRTLCFGHAVNSEMIYSSRTEGGTEPDEPPMWKEPDAVDIELRAAQEAYLLATEWRCVSAYDDYAYRADPNGTLYQRRGKQPLEFKKALDRAKYHDRKHGAHLPEAT